jgi:DNA-nicking Smr family endonuclease
MKRRTTEDERKLFEQDFKEARPIKPAKSKAVKKKPVSLPKTGGTGINGATEERLKKGLLEPQARIDLHGMTQDAAHRTLFAFLATAHARGHRLVLVITGKGNPRKDESASWMQAPHGVLKQMVPRWLNEPELAALIAKVQPAHAKHGGDGALYVYLRKPR